ncbi:MAG: hypothetical protein NE327_05420 [Lentisphaeraceae bacterium]|nr:hypothetical protein [Lentisphaeraceae bacterium]
MYRTVLLIFLLLLTSCQKSSELKYETSTLECLQALVSNTEKGKEEDTLVLLEKYSDEFKFAADLRSNYSDRLAIAKAAKAADSGKLNEAKELIEVQIVKRGYSDTLETSLNNLDKAMIIQKYIENSQELGIAERSREFAELKAHTQESFKKVTEYNKWIQAEEKKISDEANEDKNTVLKSLKYTMDYLSLNDPKLMEVILLETATHEKTAVIPGIKSDSVDEFSSKLSSAGIGKTISNIYKNPYKNYKDAQNKGVSSLQKQLSYTHLLAKAGQISKTLESLQELNSLCEIDQQFRRTVLKELFLSKGWNDASLINRDFLDISYLLETVYKANQ